MQTLVPEHVEGRLIDCQTVGPAAEPVEVEYFEEKWIALLDGPGTWTPIPYSIFPADACARVDVMRAHAFTESVRTRWANACARVNSES